MTVRKPNVDTLRKMVTIKGPSLTTYIIYADPFGIYYLYKVEKGKEVYTKRSSVSPLELEAKYCK